MTRASEDPRHQDRLGDLVEFDEDLLPEDDIPF